MIIMLLTVALVQLLALMSPGPDFFFVCQVAVSRSRQQAMLAALGITLGVMWWSGITLLGLHLLLERLRWLHQCIMLAGGGYLCWIGYQMLRSALARRRHDGVLPPAARVRTGESFIKGLLTNLSNPKVIIYFGSIFSVFVGNDISAAQRWSLFVLIVLETFAWFSVVACLFSLPLIRRGYQKLANWIDGLAGALFIGFGLHLLLHR